MSSAGDFCCYSSFKVYEISEEINQELHRGLLPEGFDLYSFLKMCEIKKEIDQELHRGLLLILLLKSVWDGKGNRPGAPQRTFAYIPHYKSIGWESK